MVRHSMIVIHCVLGFALVLIAAELFMPIPADVRADAIALFMPIAALAIAASMRTIGNAVTHQRKLVEDPGSVWKR